MVDIKVKENDKGYLMVYLMLSLTSTPNVVSRASRFFVVRLYTFMLEMKVVQSYVRK